MLSSRALRLALLHGLTGLGAVGIYAIMPEADWYLWREWALPWSTLILVGILSMVAGVPRGFGFYFCCVPLRISFARFAMFAGTASPMVFAMGVNLPLVLLYWTSRSPIRHTDLVLMLAMLSTNTMFRLGGYMSAPMIVCIPLLLLVAYLSTYDSHLVRGRVVALAWVVVALLAGWHADELGEVCLVYILCCMMIVHTFIDMVNRVSEDPPLEEPLPTPPRPVEQ